MIFFLLVTQRSPGNLELPWRQVAESWKVDLAFSHSYLPSLLSLCFLLFLPGLIIHEGPSVYRIFKRWQAVNQQWKVLNYDKTKDLEDQKSGGRTNLRTSSSTQANIPSTEEEAASPPAREEGPTRAASHPSGPGSQHHCAYTILHILSHLRPHEQRSTQGGSRELVMRVTTV